MNIDRPIAPLSRRAAIRLAACALAAPAVSFFPSDLLSSVAAAPGAAQRPPQVPAAADKAQSIPLGSVLEPSQLAGMLSLPGEKPTVICVGFGFLYAAAHIPGSRFLGPGREGNGIVALAKWGANAPKNKLVVLYCGCCPWTQCPNIAPAYTALKNLAFSQVKVLRIDQNFGADWVSKGFPTEKKK
jgi:thiosulfate/3-mercaptopyruvate sulfurtransferase